MTKKTTTTVETKTQTKKTTSAAYVLNILAYVAVCFGGVALFVAMILSKCGVSLSLIPIMQRIANAIAWLVVSILSFKFIKNRKKLWMWIVWTIAVVMIVISIIL